MRISIDAVFRESWPLVKGVKLPFFLTFLGALIAELIVFLVNFSILSLVNLTWISAFFHFLLPGFLIAPFLAGLAMLGLKRARLDAISWSSGFLYFKELPRVFLAFIIESLILWLVMVIFAFAVIFIVFVFHIHINQNYGPGGHVRLVAGLVFAIFLISVFVKSLLMFNYLLVLDKNISPFIAWYHSIKMTLHQFRAVFFGLLGLALMNIVGLCLLGMGLIWTVPFSYIVMGKLYTLCQE